MLHMSELSPALSGLANAGRLTRWHSVRAIPHPKEKGLPGGPAPTLAVSLASVCDTV